MMATMTVETIDCLSGGLFNDFPSISFPDFDTQNYSPRQLPTRPKRRQNRSCDQCRASKRACNVFDNAGFEEYDVEQVTLRTYGGSRTSLQARQPCSQCVKRRKRCTVDWMMAHKAEKEQEGATKRRKKSSGHVSDEVHQQPFEAFSAALHPVDFEQTTYRTGSDVLAYPSSTSGSSDFSFDGVQINTFMGHEDAQCLDIPSSQFVATCDSSATEPSVPDDVLGESTIDVLQLTSSGSSSDFVPQSDGSPVEDIDEVQALSPMSLYNLNSGSQRTEIKRGLLKIYHDSLEGALSCWLTERNCPYVVSKFDSRDAWSSGWSNRIILRIHALERATVKNALCRSRNDTEASEALDLAIMAFAAQWAQTSVSQNDRREGNFDRKMQTSLWHQASQALLKASGNTSFKVIFAMIVFSLTQKPQEHHEYVESMQDIFCSESTPTFLELAVRQLHSLRRMLLLNAATSRSGSMGTEAQDTFNLLFWLAIMFDTLSATMYRRPFVVKDEDSNVQEHSDTTASNLEGEVDNNNLSESAVDRSVDLWGKYFMLQRSRSGISRKSFLRWPCSFEDAAMALNDAAPVKVLLFRRVGQLRDLTCAPRLVSKAAVEFVIDAALDVYEHWGKTYGRFISDCIKHHEALPPRIQSWYILLAGHWHVAVFALADIIDEVDESSLGEASHTRLRQISHFTSNLRSESAFIVSELGRCSQLSDQESTFSQSKEFHFAVNKTALLTEPWTAVLIQSFGRAGEVLVGKLRQEQADAERTRGQLDKCIEALEVLGRKSDMALRARKLLLQHVENGGPEEVIHLGDFMM